MLQWVTDDWRLLLRGVEPPTFRMWVERANQITARHREAQGVYYYYFTTPHKTFLVIDWKSSGALSVSWKLSKRLLKMWIHTKILLFIPTIHSILEVFKTRRSGNGIRTHASVLGKMFLALSTLRRRSPLRTCFDLCFDIVATWLVDESACVLVCSQSDWYKKIKKFSLLDTFKNFLIKKRDLVYSLYWK